MACTNDILGNRLSKGTVPYTWDALNRMASHVDNSAYVAAGYQYRADGMRVKKNVSPGALGAYNWTRFRYDGQMGIEDHYVEEPGGTCMLLKVTRYGLGARGIDYMEQTTTNYQGGPGGGTTTNTIGFPVYDGHGNMVATLSRSGSNSYALSNQRSFDACRSVTEIPRGRRMSEVEDPASGEAAIGTNREGSVRLGAGTGDPLRFARALAPVRHRLPALSRSGSPPAIPLLGFLP